MPSSTSDYHSDYSPPNGDGSSPPPPSKNKKNSPSPPPPPSSRRSGSHKKSSHKSKNSSSDGGKSSNSGAVIGAAIGSTLLLLVVALLFVVCCKRRKQKSRRMAYYADDSFVYRDNKFYNNNQHKWNTFDNNQQKWYTPSPINSEFLVRLPPEPPSGPQSSFMSSDYGWSIRPPPPMFSSEMSSAGFSSGPLQPPPPPSGVLGLGQSTFRYQDLVAATNNFAKENLLGQGGFSYIYKGILANGKEVAVKCLKQNSGQGEREFQSEVEIISRVHHRHLVSLVGYCITGSQRMLVYEFVPNGTLEYHLHGPDRPVMDWPTRLKIAIGAAKGFAYLHEDCGACIIHRDIKAANILLDMNFEPKVADFGLAKLSQENLTHVSTRVMGTFGYLAPEYVSSGKLTEKSDVFSFGIVLLELITGRRPTDSMNPDDEDGLVDWGRPYLDNATAVGSYQELIDPRLEDNYDVAEMYRMVHSAAACVRQSARRRPKMSQIVRALDGDMSLDEVKTAVHPSPGMYSRNNSEYDLTKLG